MAESGSIVQTINDTQLEGADNIASATAEIFSVIAGRVENAQCYEDDEGRLYITSGTVTGDIGGTGVVDEEGETYSFRNTERISDEVKFVRINVENGKIDTGILSGDEVRKEDLGIEEVEVFTAEYLD